MTAIQQIEQLCIEARAHGMTYGKYVEKMKPNMPPPDSPTKKKRRIAKERERVCCECGKTFVARSDKAQRCKECKRERMLVSNRERWRTKYAKIQKQENNS